MLAAVAVLALTGTAHAQAPLRCEVAMEFSVEGKRVAAPLVVADFGNEAEVTVGKPDQTGAWRFRLVADAPAVVRRVTTIPVEVEIYELTAGHEYLRASPHIAAVPGQRVELDMIFGNEDGRRAHLSLTATPRSDAEIEAIESRMRGDNP